MSDARTDDLGTAACVALAEGPWQMTGDCWIVAENATLTLVGEGCRFRLDDWELPGLPLPTGGTVDGHEVTLTGDSEWDNCVGNAATPNAFDGTCAPENCTFIFHHER